MNYKTMTSSRSFLCAVVLFFGLSLPALAQDDEDLGERFDIVPIPEGLTKEDVRDVIARSFIDRGWTVKERSDTRVVGYLKQRGNEAEATFLYGPEQVEMYCKGWAINRRGERVKPEQPRGWLGNLKKDITKGLNLKSMNL